MKIYTEINYEWLDGQLIETSSESFNYNGSLTLCSGNIGGTTEETLNAAKAEKERLQKKAEEERERIRDAAQAEAERQAQTLEQPYTMIESGINTGFDDLHDYGKAVNTVVSDELTRWSDAGMKFAKEVGVFMGHGDDTGAVTLDPEKFAIGGGKKKKDLSELAANKAKSQGRSSLKIG